MACRCLSSAQIFKSVGWGLNQAVDRQVIGGWTEGAAGKSVSGRLGLTRRHKPTT